MLLRCKLDGLLLDACRHSIRPAIRVFDGDESFEMERMEAAYYELVRSTAADLNWIHRTGYRCLRLASDFALIGERLRA
jgi:hypothetical protein